MEYHVDINGPLTQQAVEEAVREFLRSPSRTEVRSAWSTNGFGQRPPSLLSPGGSTKPYDSFTWPSSSGPSGWTKSPVEFTLMSDWGGRHYHFFVWRGRILSVRNDVWHPRWTLMPARRWYSSVSFLRVGAGVAYESPGNHSISQWTQEQKIMEAMKRAPGRVPGHLKTYLAELLTPANIVITVGLTVALMASGIGEVIGLGLLVVGAVTGGLDLVLVVLKMLYQFYKKASNATTERELDEAADLFAQALMRGGTDIIDMVIGRRAVSKLAGRGFKSVGEFFSYLDREMSFVHSRNAGGGRPLPGTAPQQAGPAAPAQSPAARKPGKLAAGTPEHKAQRWKEYQARNGPKTYEQWSKQYDVNMRNATHGLSREAEYRDAMGGTSTTVKTPFTNRQVDVYVADKEYMGQIKTGKVSLTEQAKIDIAKDAALVRQGMEVEYILEKGASKPFLEALDKQGIKYKIGPQIPQTP